MPLPDLQSGSSYLGPVVNKIDYQNLPPANSKTDLSMPLVAQGFCDLAGLTQTCFQAAVSFTTAATTGALVLNSWYATWGNATEVAPTLARTGTGVFTITFPTVVSDEYNLANGLANNHTVSLHLGLGTINSSSTFGFCNVAALNNVLTVYLANTSGSASDLVGVIVKVASL
jgi:hypothetical protein